MLGKGMPINKKDYEELNPYYDYQRKVAYNKEQVMNLAMNFEGRIFDQFGPVSLPEFRIHLWDKIQPEEYEEPPSTWVPEDETMRIEGEVYRPEQKIMFKVKHKQQVLDN